MADLQIAAARDWYAGILLAAVVVSAIVAIAQRSFIAAILGLIALALLVQVW